MNLDSVASELDFNNENLSLSNDSMVVSEKLGSEDLNKVMNLSDLRDKNRLKTAGPNYANKGGLMEKVSKLDKKKTQMIDNLTMNDISF